MPVLFDSSKAASKYIENSASGSLTWNHNINPTATNTVVYVAAVLSGHVGISGATWTATFGGVTMTAVGTPTEWSDNAMVVFELQNPTAGQNAAVVSFTGAGTSIITSNFMACSSSYKNVAAIGTAIQATPTNSAACEVIDTTNDAPNPACTVVSFHGCGIGYWFPEYNGTQRAINPFLIGSGAILIGDLPGAATVTADATLNGATSGWGAYSIAMTPTVVNVTAAAPPFGFGDPVGRCSIQRVSTPPTTRQWTIPAPLSGMVSTTPCTSSLITSNGNTTSFSQGPESVLDYGIIWSDWLNNSGDTLAQVVFNTSDPTVTVLSQDVDTTGTMAVVWLQGGQAGQSYTIDCHITTTGGRQDDRSFTLNIVQGL